MTNSISTFDSKLALSHLTHNFRNPIGILSMMVSAKDFVSSAKGNWVSFKFRGSTKFNYCKITLNAMDEYNLEISKLNTTNAIVKGAPVFKIQKVYEGIPTENMKETFENLTGLYLSLS